MATAWVRSLSCRSYGVADAVVAPSPSKKLQSPPVSCAAAKDDVRDSVAFVRHSAKKPRREEERPRREPRPRPKKKKPKQVLAASVAFMPSGAAHASAGAGSGRRAMLVCRVIAGRVRSAQHQHGHSRHASDYDSVDMGNGELVVLDSRAVLPCFLIIYKV
uniref:Uncharacterized protein n=1 Tax=Oryza barthii TaxID=65489 RepID=A0A0D3HGG6_9ORYZ